MKNIKELNIISVDNLMITNLKLLLVITLMINKNYNSKKYFAKQNSCNYRDILQ